jgi:hypothetical protein
MISSQASIKAPSGVQLDILKNLEKMFLKNAEQQFGGFFNIQGVSTDTMKPPAIRVMGHLFGGIIVQGGDFRLTIKIHSDCAPLRPLCAKNMQIAESEVGEKVMRDFLREVANLLGGAMRTELARNNVDAGLSLPLSSRGFDEVFFDSTEGEKSFLQACRVRWDGGVLYMTQFLEILAGWDSLTPIKDYNPSAPVVDDFEALLSQGT